MTWPLPMLNAPFKATLYTPAQSVEVVKLCVEGKTDEQIAPIVGIDRKAVHNIVSTSMTQYINFAKKLHPVERLGCFQALLDRQLVRASGIEQKAEPKIEPSNEPPVQKEAEKQAQSNDHQINQPPYVVKRWGLETTTEVINIIRAHPNDPAGQMLKHIRAANPELILWVRSEDLMEHWAELRKAAGLQPLQSVEKEARAMGARGRIL